MSTFHYILLYLALRTYSIAFDLTTFDYYVRVLRGDFNILTFLLFEYVYCTVWKHFRIRKEIIDGQETHKEKMWKFDKFFNLFKIAVEPKIDQSISDDSE